MREGDPAHVRNAKIGIVFQSFHLIPTLTARENVGMPFYIIGLTKSLLGAAADVGLSILLVDVAGDVVTLFINWQFSPELRGGDHSALRSECQPTSQRCAADARLPSATGANRARLRTLSPACSSSVLPSA